MQEMPDTTGRCETDACEKSDTNVDEKDIKDLREDKENLLAKVQTAKQDLRKWRKSLSADVDIYQAELDELRVSLDVNFKGIRQEFEDVRKGLREDREEAQHAVVAARMRRQEWISSSPGKNVICSRQA